jgi:hypothetical protein
MHERANRPSSTSSSDRSGSVRRDVSVTGAVLVAALILVDVGFRLVLPDLSQNSRILARAPERAERLRAASARGELTVLVLGNSIGRDGIDPHLLGDLLRARGIRAHLEHQPADSSDVRDWYYQLKNQFVAAGAVPDLLLLPVGNLDPLIRQTEPSEDLLYSFLRPADLFEFFALSAITDMDERAALVLGKVWAVYGFRGRLQGRVLTELFSGYPDLHAWIRRSGVNDAATERRGRRVTALWAERLDALADRLGIRIVVIAMPTSDIEGRLPRADREVAERLGWQALEPAAAGGFGARERPDGLHLTPAARAHFTRLLAPHLARLLFTLCRGETSCHGVKRPLPRRIHLFPGGPRAGGDGTELESSAPAHGETASGHPHGVQRALPRPHGAHAIPGGASQLRPPLLRVGGLPDGV